MKSWPNPARQLRACGTASEIVFKLQSPRLSAAHQNRKRVVETQRLADRQVELLRILLFDLIVNRARIGDRRMLEYRRVSRAGVFRIEIDLARQQRIVRQVSAQLKLAFNCDSARFEHLRHDLAENRRLSEIF